MTSDEQRLLSSYVDALLALRRAREDCDRLAEYMACACAAIKDWRNVKIERAGQSSGPLIASSILDLDNLAGQ